MPTSLPEVLTTTPVWPVLGLLATLAILLALAARFGERRPAGSGTGPVSSPPARFLPLRAEVRRQLTRRWDALLAAAGTADALRRADAMIAEAMWERGCPPMDAAGRFAVITERYPDHAVAYAKLRAAVEGNSTRWSQDELRDLLDPVGDLFDAIVRDEGDPQAGQFAA